MPQSSVDPVVSSNLRSALKQAGRSPREVATALGHAPNWLYRVMRGDAGLLLPALRRLAEELGVPLGSLVEDRSESPGAGTLQFGADSPTTITAGDGVGGPVPWPSNETTGFVRIPEFGTPPMPDLPRLEREIIGWQQIEQHRLEALGADPADCEMVRVRSTVTNLIPQDGCLVLVNRGLREPMDGRVYLLYTREGLAVKRLEWDDGFEGWAFVADWPEWPRRRWPLWKDMVILGEALSEPAFNRSP